MKKQTDKIKKLLALSKSPNENEAAVALARAMKLCAENNINIDDVEASGEGNIVKEMLGKPKSYIDRHEEELCSGLAVIFGCRMFEQSSVRAEFNFKKRYQLGIVGYPNDIEIFHYTFDYLMTEIKRFQKDYMKTVPKYLTQTQRLKVKTSYSIGLVFKILDNAKAFFNKETEETKEKYGLIIKRGALVERMGCADMKQSNWKAPKVITSSFNKGHEDGDNIGLRRGVYGSNKKQNIKQIA